MHRAIKRATFRPLTRKQVSDEMHRELREEVKYLRGLMESTLEHLAGAHRAWRSVFRNASQFATLASDTHDFMLERGRGVKGLERPLTAAAEAAVDAYAAVGASTSKARGGGMDDAGRGSGSDGGRHVTPPGGTAVALTRLVRVWVQEVRGMKVDMNAAAVAEKEAARYMEKVDGLKERLRSRRGGDESKLEDRLSRNLDKLENAQAAHDATLDKVNRRMRDALNDGGEVLEAVVLAYWSLYGDMVNLAGQAGEAGAGMVDDRVERVLLRSSSRSRMGSLGKLLGRSASHEERGRRTSRERRRSPSPERLRSSDERHHGPLLRHSRGSSQERRLALSGSERHRSLSGDARRHSRSGDGHRRSRSGDGRHRSRSGERRRLGEHRRSSGGFLRRLVGKD